MPELFPQQLKANFTPEQQDYYLLLANELKELLGGQTQEEMLASGDPEIIQKIFKIKQEMLNFVLTKKTREMVRQEEEEQGKQSISLDEIERKHNTGEELTDNELKFLYQIDRFGLPFNASRGEKNKVENIVRLRNVKQDVSRVLDCDDDQVSLTQEEYLEGEDIVYHFGDLDLFNLKNTKGLNFPKYIHGYLNLNNLTTAEGLVLPQSIGGFLNLSGLITTKGLKLPQSIGGSLDLRSITSAEGLKLPQKVYGVVYLDKLNTSEYLEIPLGVKRISLQAMPNSEIEKIKKKFPHVEILKR